MAVKKIQQSKVKVGGVKKRSMWKLGLMGLAAVLVISLVGYVGFTKYQERSLKAHAASWTWIGTMSPSGQSVNAPKIANVYACKRQVSTYYGPLNYVTVMFVNRTSNPHLTTQVGINRYGTPHVTWTPTYNSWWGTAQSYTFAAGSVNDNIVLTFNAWGGPTGGVGVLTSNVSSLNNC